MQKLSSLLILLLTLSLLSPTAEARKKKKLQVQKLSGVVQKCHDGDTCRIVVRDKVLKIRFAGIDTPELKQKFGKDAQAFTESKIKNRKVDLECEGLHLTASPARFFLKDAISIVKLF